MVPVKPKKKKKPKKKRKKKPKNRSQRRAPRRTTALTSTFGGTTASSSSSFSSPEGVVQHPKLSSEYIGATIHFDRDLSCVAGTSNKFYRLQALETTHGTFASVFHFGRIGTKGQIQVKLQSSADAAVKECENKMEAKMKGNKYQEMQSRVSAAGGKTGDIQISLMWNNNSQRNDLDLHVVAPSGEELMCVYNFVI